VLSVPLSNQLQIPFLATRAIYEIRERPSRMYSWTALITAQILVEVPWNILGSTLYFLTWYWTSRFTTERAGYAYLGIGVLLPIYYTTIAQAIASMAPNAEVAAILFGFLFSFVLTLYVALFPHFPNAFDDPLLLVTV
jgi:ATP-binding cassette, subfamily G (WHITE), member 2, SNQ2